MKKYRKLLLFFLFVFALLVPVVKVDARVIVDMSGREVQLPDEVRRIVTTYKSATHFIFALGAQDRLVAIDIGSPKQILFQTLMPEIKKLPTVGSKRKGLNLEEIIRAEPDLVVLFPYNDGPVIAEKLAQQGIASIIIKPESFSQIKETNMLLGRALNLKERAQAVDNMYDFILEQLKVVDNIPEEDKKVVYFSNSEFLDSVGGEMMQNSLIDLAGGFSPTGDLKSGFIKTSPEELINWNPEIIIVSQLFNGDIAELKKCKKYQSINAFQEDNIYRIPANIDSWDFPGPSSYLAIIWLSQLLYPEKYTDLNLENLVDNFYYTLYGRTFTELKGQLY